MSILGIVQPNVLVVSETVRLRAFDGDAEFALPWYRDSETLFLVDGKRDPYDMEHLMQMYRYLDAHGELYWIEVQTAGEYRPIGDVTFSTDDLPIVIGDRSCRGKGIGRQVITALISRARQLGFASLSVKEIYSYNIGSRRLFTHLGFRETGTTEAGNSFRLDLM